MRGVRVCGVTLSLRLYPRRGSAGDQRGPDDVPARQHVLHRGPVRAAGASHAVATSPFFLCRTPRVDECCLSVARVSVCVQGIHCRFGMSGIIAEGHFDSGRNFVALVQGRRRYILSSPDQCRCVSVCVRLCVQLIVVRRRHTTGRIAQRPPQHMTPHVTVVAHRALLCCGSKIPLHVTGPMARHTSTDWSEPKSILELRGAKGIDVSVCNCDAASRRRASHSPHLCGSSYSGVACLLFQVVMEAGDVLYIPSLWFHYIVSLSPNVQCNTRSGQPGRGADDIRKCGFNVRVTESGPRRVRSHACVCVCVCAPARVCCLSSFIRASTSQFEHAALLLRWPLLLCVTVNSDSWRRCHKSRRCRASSR